MDEDPMTPPDVVYAHQDGATYVARFDEDDDQWFRWPAEAHGWRRRVRCSEATADEAEELPPRLAELALRLSGVPTDDT
jgi:hypothetical protein